MIRKIISKEIQKILLIGVTFFVLILIWGGKSIYKQSNQKLEVYKKQRQRVKLENKVGRKLNELVQLKKKMIVIRESSRFLAEVAKIAGQLNLKLTAISALPREKHNDFIKVSISLEIDTTYHELGMFVSKLESGDVLMAIDKLNVNTKLNKANANSPKILAKLIISTFALTDTILEK